MVIKADDALDPGQPALVVLYGNTARKHRALNRPVMVLGRARGCDIGLEAPDVSNVHCVIIRTPEGFQIRDCASRTGTRLNGDVIEQAPLHNEDVLQVGPFSFQVQVPPPQPPQPPPMAIPVGPDQIGRLERSRRNLARLALAQRSWLRRLRAAGPMETPDAAPAARQADLDARAAALEEQARDLDRRARQLEQAERDLAARREAVAREEAAFQERVRQAEQELARLREKAEADLRANRNELQEQLRQEDEQRRADVVRKMTDLLASLQQLKDELADRN
jgi:hypothetical protein